MMMMIHKGIKTILSVSRRQPNLLTPLQGIKKNVSQMSLTTNLKMGKMMTLKIISNSLLNRMILICTLRDQTMMRLSKNSTNSRIWLTRICRDQKTKIKHTKVTSKKLATWLKTIRLNRKRCLPIIELRKIKIWSVKKTIRNFFKYLLHNPITDRQSKILYKPNDSHKKALRKTMRLVQMILMM